MSGTDDSDTFDWAARLEPLLAGALAVWRVEGTVTRKDDACCAIRCGSAAITVSRVTDDGDPYWEVASADGSLPPLPFGGIQGMLRAVRELLGAEEAGTRIVIGTRGEA